LDSFQNNIARKLGTSLTMVTTMASKYETKEEEKEKKIGYRF